MNILRCQATCKLAKGQAYIKERQCQNSNKVTCDVYMCVCVVCEVWVAGDVNLRRLGLLSRLVGYGAIPSLLLSKYPDGLRNTPNATRIKKQCHNTCYI